MPGSTSPLIAALLSALMPGLGQCYAGERAKGLTILCMAVGVLTGILWASIGPTAFHSFFSVALLGLIYLFVWIPSILDASQLAQGQSATILSGEKAWYVIVMLLTIGPMAIPFLWQSRKFSRTAKILWTLFVIGIAAASIVAVLFVGPLIEQLLTNTLIL